MLSRYIGVGGCGIDGNLSSLGGVIYLLDGCILLFTCEGVVSFNRGLLGVCCLVYFCLRLRFRVRYWVDCCDGCFTLALLSRYICVSGCGVDGVLSGLRGVVNLVFWIKLKVTR